MSTLLLIQSSINIFKDANLQSKRDLQITKSFKRLAKYNDIFVRNNIDIILFDNTCDTIPQHLLKLLSKNIKVICVDHNTGKDNKGVGLIDGWKYLANTIRKYEWIIHYESRLFLKRTLFFNMFVANKQMYFLKETDFEQHRMYFTGLFSIKSEFLLKYIEQEDTDYMLNINNKDRAIEFRLGLFLEKNNVPLVILNELGIIRYYMKKGKVRRHYH